LIVDLFYFLLCEGETIFRKFLREREWKVLGDENAHPNRLIQTNSYYP